MSERELCMKLLDSVPEYKIGYVLAYLQGLTVSDEAADDAFCEQLYRQYEADPDKGEIMTEAELCRELGISL